MDYLEISNILNSFKDEIVDVKLKLNLIKYN